MKKMRRSMALFLTLAMILPMTAGIVHVSAEETETEIPTETIPAGGQGSSEPKYQVTDVWDFSEASQGADFTFFASGDQHFSVADGLLKTSGRYGEQKALLTNTPDTLKSVSVDIVPGESGRMDGGLVIGVSDPSNNVDGLVGMGFYIASNWTDAPNRTDLVQGAHNNNWREVSRVSGNSLFKNGVKEPVNLRLDFSEDMILATMSLVSNPSKQVQQIYEVDSTVFNGQVGVRQYDCDVSFDNFCVEYLSDEDDNYRIWDFASSAQEISMYQSGEAGFVIEDGMLTPGADQGEMQAVFEQDMSIMDSVSVDLIPGQSGTVDADVLVGLSKDNNAIQATRSVQADPLAEHLVAHYTFDDADNLGYDASGNGKDATPVGAMSGVSGIRGGAASFNGTGGRFDAYFNVPGDITHSENITLMTWVKYDRSTLKEYARIFEFLNGDYFLHLSLNHPMSWAGYRGFFSSVSETGVYLAKGGARSVNGTNIPNVGDTAFVGNQWHHLAMVLDDTTMYLYINGHLAATAAHSGNPAELAATAGRIGTTGVYDDASYIGLMDDFRVYNKALTAEEIASVNDFAPEDFLIFDLDFESTNPVADVSGNDTWTNVETGTLDVVEGKNGLGVYFDGGDAVRIQRDLLYGNQGTTVSTWIKVDELPAVYTYLWDFALDSSNSTFLCMPLSNGIPTIAANVADGTGKHTVTNSTAIPTGEWVHLAYTMEAGSACLYMNGILIGKNENIHFDAADLAWTNYDYIGRGNWSSSDPWYKGYMDDFQIYSRVLTDSEIMQIAGLEAEEQPIEHEALTFGIDPDGAMVSGQYAAGWTELERKAGFAEGVSEPVNMRLDFGESTVTVTVTLLSDPSVSVQYAYDVDPAQLQGKIGLRVADSDTCFDNLRVDYKENVRVWDFTCYEPDFTLYQSSTDGFGYENGILTPTAANKEIKAILEQNMEDMQSVSVNIIPGASGTIRGGILFGVSNESTSVDGFNGMALTLLSNYTGWDDAPNRVDIVHGFHNYSYTELGRHVTENLKGNGLFSDGVKEPLTLKLEFGEDNIVTATMSVTSDPSRYAQYTYEIDPAYLQGKIGLKVYDSDTCFDNLVVTYKDKEDTTVETVTYLNEGYSFFADSNTWKLSEELTETPYTVEAWVKVPEGLDENSTGYILTNAIRAPYISMQMAEGGKLRLSVGVEDEGLAIVNKNYDADTDLRTGKWTHIAYTMDAAADQVVAYINGEAVSAWDNAGLPAFSFPDHIIPDNLMTIGSLSKESESLNKIMASEPLMGWIADVRIWNRSLSAQEVKDSMLTQYTQSRDGLMVNVPLNEKQDNAFADLSGNGNDVTEFSDKINLEAQTHEPGAYSMIVIPDQQILTTSFPDKLNALYQWIADNREKENIQIVMTTGDNVDHNGNVTEWENAKAAWELLPDDLPFVSVPGNHDYDTYAAFNANYGDRSQLTLMNQYFPQSLFADYSTEIGFFDEVNSANHWQAFTVNGHPYLIIALEYVPQDDVVAWANEVVEAHPDHQVIMLTHSYVGSFGELDRPYLWSEFVSKHENIIMGISGHVWEGTMVHRTDEGINGNKVHSMLMNAQFTDWTTDGYAMVGILRFNADGTLCNVSYYSTDKDMYEANSSFTLEIPNPKTIVAQVGETTYTSVTEAAANANGQVVIILADTDEEITISADVTIDLAGNSLSIVTVAEGATLTLIDSATDDYEGEYGSAVVTGTVVGGENYLLVSENGAYSAHRYDVAITHISLKPDADALGYKAQLKGDAVVQSHVESFGFNLWLSEDNVKTYGKAGANMVTLRLKGILAANGGEMPIYAQPFVKFANGDTVKGDSYSTTMKDTLQMVNTAWADYSATQQNAVKALCDKYAVTKNWKLTNIYPATEETTPPA